MLDESSTKSDKQIMTVNCSNSWVRVYSFLVACADGLYLCADGIACLSLAGYTCQWHSNRKAKAPGVVVLLPAGHPEAFLIIVTWLLYQVLQENGRRNFCYFGDGASELSDLWRKSCRLRSKEAKSAHSIQRENHPSPTPFALYALQEAPHGTAGFPRALQAI